MAWTTPGTATAGEVLTAAFWNTNVRDNTTAVKEAAFYIATATRTTDYSISTNLLASAADVFSSDLTFTAESGKLYRFEYFFPRVLIQQDSTIYFDLVNGSGSSLGLFAQIGQFDPTYDMEHNIVGSFLYAAGSGSVSFNIRLTRTAGASVAYAGAGGAGTLFPIRLTVYGPVD